MDVRLVMFKPDGQRKDFPLSNSTTVIGRGEDCHLRVPIASVSRQHCQVSLSGDSVSVKDLGSSNGTYVNNDRVTEKDVSAGDRIAIGPIVFTVQIDGRPEQITPVKTRGQKMAEAGEPGAEQVVDLEADVVSQLQGAGEEEQQEQPAIEAADDEDSDPISALEALAQESQQDPQEESSQDRQQKGPQ